MFTLPKGHLITSRKCQIIAKTILRCHPERSKAEPKDLGEAGLAEESAVNYINVNCFLTILIPFKADFIIGPLREILRLHFVPLRMTA